MRLLVIRFQAVNAAHIRNENCPVDCWVIPIGCSKLQAPGAPEGPNNRLVTVLYLFYLMVREGLNRARGILAPQGLMLGGYRRDFRWYDGKPMWTPVSGGQTAWDHPGGYRRTYNAQQQRWYWCLNGQNQAWDTN